MQIREVLESANITHDDKARRVLNTAPDKQADITLEEIKAGVTIERLESLSVPVYQYGGQITIHGIFKDVPDDLRVHGYKSVVLNQNQSLGVKYVAIDGAKKDLLHDISRYSKTRWSIHINSQGCEAIQIFHSNDRDSDIQRLKECYNSTPDDLYIGSKSYASLMWGGFAVILYIGAIYERNVWPLIKALTGIESQAEFDVLHAKSEAEFAEMVAKGEAEREVERKALAIEIANVKANFKVPDHWIPFQDKITQPGTYARIQHTHWDGIALHVIKTAKRGAYICSNERNFKDLNFVDWTPSHYSKCNLKIDGWQILDKPVKQSTSIKPKSENTITDGKPVITHNDKLNGIEVKFGSKPDDTILNTLRDLGFRWSYKSMLWYNRYSDDLMTKVQAQIC